MNRRIHILFATIAVLGATLSAPILAQDKMSGDKMTHEKMAKGGKMAHDKMSKGGKMAHDKMGKDGGKM
jgi:pentapeptide MXKDX repeat protein